MNQQSRRTDKRISIGVHANCTHCAIADRLLEILPG